MIKSIAIAAALLLPTQIAASEKLIDLLASQETVQLVKLELPLSLLTSALEAEIPKTFKGRRGISVSVIKDERAEWNISRSPITLTANGSTLVAMTRASGTVSVKGRISVVGSTSVSETAGVTANATLKLTPQLGPDWVLYPNATGKATLSKAELRIAGVKVSIRSKLQGPLDSAVNKALAKSTTELRNPSLLKDLVRPIWASLCADTDIGKTSVMAMPQKVYASQPMITSSSLQFTVAVTSKIVPKAADMTCPNLPGTLELL